MVKKISFNKPMGDKLCLTELAFSYWKKGLLEFWRILFLRRKKKMLQTQQHLLLCRLNYARAFSAPFGFPVLFLNPKKRGKVMLIPFVSPYGLFLIVSIASTAPIMTMTMMMATIPYSMVVLDAKLVAGVAVGALVAGAFIMLKKVSALDE